MFCVLIGFAMLFVAFVTMVLIWLSGAGLTGFGVVAFQYRWLRAVRDAGHRVSLLDLLRLHLREARAAATLGWWHVRAFFTAGRQNPGNPTGAPVLLVHGYTQNGTNMWGLQRRLLREGRASERISLGIPWPWRRVEDYAEVLATALARHPEGVWVVAHSMGGIVLREVLTRHAELREHVLGAVTLGTPHLGTAVHPAVVTFIRPADQLAQDAPWLRMLPTLPQLLPGRRITTVGSIADMIVYPESSTRQPGARHHTLEGIGHGGLLTHPTPLGIAVDAVTSPAR